VLDNINLRFNPGEFISLIGPSGCGKSTLLRLIAGLIRPGAGTIDLDGEEVLAPGYERGLVFQDPTLFPWKTIYENIAFGLRARKVYRREKHTIPGFFKLVGLEGFEKSYPHQLSGGMAQRASLARALVNNPKVLLLDEPLGALDAFTRMNMQDEILKIWERRGMTSVMVTHDVDEAIYMADRIVVMSARPAKIEQVITVEIGRPRRRDDPDFLDLRAKILQILHFAGSREELQYYL
jgi:ABC-type nitrate/sulfonate/bicarbonate transport system ATPase subunit